MAWPSSKAATTSTDSPNDTISGSRADINLTISNVNDIVDFIDPTSLANGDILVYNASSGALERKDNNSVTDEAQTYSRTQNFAQTTLTDASTIAWDLSQNQVAQVTLGDNRVLGAATNQTAGATYILIVKQDGTGGRTLDVSNALYKFPGGVEPVVASGANDVSIFSFVSDGSNLFGNMLADFS
tara:strand:- start:821 stop:1375 length:555 start_codon:yes stop_codon:yes gene_type:complete